jgi:hypothetical protein
MASIREPLDNQLHAIVMEHLSKLEGYVPGPLKKAGGTKDGLLQKFRADPLFSIFGMDSPEYAAATLAGGTITSIHRKIGDIYEGCIKTIFMVKLNQSAEHVSYHASIMSGTTEEARSADAYLQFDRLDKGRRKRVFNYCKTELGKLTKNPQINLVGVGMEVRHCYQTGDSKRTQADEALARHLLVSGILPIMPLFCNQSNPGIIRRYRSVWVVKQGMESYDLVKEFSGYDFHDFLVRNKDDFRAPVLKALRSLTQ